LDTSIAAQFEENKAVSGALVARMERSEIRGCFPLPAKAPDCASLHPGYE
jgi:hypothetical protein